MSAYFTVFAWSYLKLHTTKLENADELYERHLGKAESMFKVLVVIKHNYGSKPGCFLLMWWELNHNVCFDPCACQPHSIGWDTDLDAHDEGSPLILLPSYR